MDKNYSSKGCCTHLIRNIEESFVKIKVIKKGLLRKAQNIMSVIRDGLKELGFLSLSR